MIVKLYNLLEQYGLEPTIEDVADILWLAHIMTDTSKEIKISEESKKNDLIDDKDEDARNKQIDYENKIKQNKKTEKSESTTIKDAKLSTQPLRSEENERWSSENGTLIRVPTSPSFIGQLEIARALRPLMRKVPSIHTLELDYKATIHNYADTEILIPLQKPILSRWLDITLIFEISPSMMIWKDFFFELKDLIETQGAFRDVQAWRFISDNQQKDIKLFKGFEERFINQTERSPSELIDPLKRRLIIVVSDCNSEAWHEGYISKLFINWMYNCRFAILQTLPYYLWEQSGLGNAKKVYLKNRHHTDTNINLTKIGRAHV